MQIWTGTMTAVYKRRKALAVIMAADSGRHRTALSIVMPGMISGMIK